MIRPKLWLLTNKQTNSLTSFFYLVGPILGAEVSGGQIGGDGQLLLVHDDSAVSEQRQPC